jgi:hypothetical protein
MLSISNQVAAELARLLPQAAEIIPTSDDVHAANVRRRLIKLAKYIGNAERKEHKLRMGETTERDS